ncbi:hypothetical protein [Streptomyces sp. CS131]|uniref:hypothetical protein n=1 Tax=Streptomyces sp. CS131 TaxID=2162711 RepID=UPI001EF5D2F9|nr:hypothetical protein [Streptomyces sp. CS131]
MGWLLRHADATVHLWVDARGTGRPDPRLDPRHDAAAPVAVGFLDGRVLRVTAAPDAVLGTCAALADRGASAVDVVTPARNGAAVALYASAGFTVVRETQAWTRSRRS